MFHRKKEEGMNERGLPFIVKKNMFDLYAKGGGAVPVNEKAYKKPYF